MQEKKENISTSLSKEDLEKYKERELALKTYHSLLVQKENELADLKTAQLDREKQYYQENKEREKLFATRERELLQRQKAVEEKLHQKLKESEILLARRERELSDRQKKSEELLRRRNEDIDQLRTELIQREAALANALQELELEKARYNEESRKQIEGKSRNYVIDALDSLDKKEKLFHRLSIIWSSIGAISLSGGLLFFGYVTIKGFSSIPAEVTWEFITFYAFKGLIAVALFIALAKYASLLSNSYMQEALKNGDRRHAINFGKFYLELYGAAAEWSQIKEAFEHWNIVGSNAFSKREENSLDVMSLEKLASVLEKISKSFPLPGKEKDSE